MLSIPASMPSNNRALIGKALKRRVGYDRLPDPKRAKKGPFNNETNGRIDDETTGEGAVTAGNLAALTFLERYAYSLT